MMGLMHPTSTSTNEHVGSGACELEGLAGVLTVLGPVVRADGDAPEIKVGRGFQIRGVDTGGLAEEGFGLGEQIAASRCTAARPPDAR
jgi:hypothetical protein